MPEHKSQRVCVNPTGNLDAKIQDLKVDFSIGNSSGTIDKITWDFGNTSTTVTTGTTVSYTYPAAGSYTVKATLKNSCKDSTILQSIISVINPMIPVVSLQPVTELSQTSATLQMAITSNGNVAIRRFGICYSTTNTVPDITKDPIAYKDEAGTINAPISFSLTTLSPNTTYYARSFAINDKGTAYSDPVQTFRTGQNPVVATNGVVTAETTTAIVYFVLAVPGNPASQEFGICYSANITTPEVTNSSKAIVSSPAANTYIAVNLTDLTPDKTYYYRPYAILSSGAVIYGETVMSFTTQMVTITQDLIASVSFTNKSLQDISGYNNHIRTTADNPTFTTDRKGRANSAILLDGVKEYCYMRESSSLNPDAISISIWIKPSAVNRTMQIYNKSRFSDGAAEMYSSLIRPSDSGSSVIINTDIKQQSNCERGKGWQTFSFSSSPNLSQWHHLVLVYSGNSARMYFDNVALASSDNLPENTLEKCLGGDLKFGAQSSDLPNYFYGALDDIRIYKRALTAAEVQILYNQ
ncbi:hypothetical protein GCM10028805_22150 [Spirosoma harenae]